MKASSRRDGGSPPRIVYVVTSPLTADLLLRGQLASVAAAGFDVTLVCSPGERLERAAAREGVTTIALPLSREIAPLTDLVALFRLRRLLRRLRPDVLNASTPKAGLLGLLAGRWAGVPIRIYTLRGLRLETTRGLKRRLLLAAERTAARAAHHLIAVGPSLARRCRELGILPRGKISVLAKGSSNGVRRPPPELAAAAPRQKAELGIPADAPVLGFVGRLTRDKGVTELAEAFRRLAPEVPELRLLIVGDFETGDPVDSHTVSSLAGNPEVIVTGFVADATPYYPLMDLLVFPSHREGFPNAPLEAAIAGVPTVGCAATGTVDAIVDGVTGTLVPVGDAAALATAIADYLARPERRLDHGEAARQRAEGEFRPESIWQALVDLYRSLLEEERRQDPAPGNEAGASAA